MCCRIICFIVT